ncbi:ABC transporter permease [Microbacterium sp. RD1]|uniref:ABC transporter permease n=1 Tax=Microbacterium sp. RD1 TaxID=3457313 RepID=UPI003FA5AD76
MTAVSAVDPAPRAASLDRRRVFRVLKGAAGLATLVVVFELARLTGILPPGSVPSTLDIARALGSGVADGTLTAATGATILAWALGLLAAVVIGVPIGLAMGLSRWADGTLDRLVEFLRPIPVIALVPIAIVTFGIQIAMQVFLVAIACTWPLLIGTRSGVRAVDPLQVETAATLHVGRMSVIRRVILPSAIPSIATGLRVAASLAVVVAVAAELISGSPGLGQLLVNEQRAGDTAGAWACIVLTGVIGVVVNIVLGFVERAVAGWQEQATEGRR